jgi:hypothetical protein
MKNKPVVPSIVCAFVNEKENRKNSEERRVSSEGRRVKGEE